MGNITLCCFLINGWAKFPGKYYNHVIFLTSLMLKGGRISQSMRLYEI